jgi:hypothetical protein
MAPAAATFATATSPDRHENAARVASKNTNGGGHSVRALVAYAEFMVKTGMLKTKPDSWKDVFFPYVYEKGGS